ncbi:MAG: hypothetical protein KJI71_04995 [Patescibacteria group bacterium]|nr:hypothetical protein [Patescibacteria group bacterium]
MIVGELKPEEKVAIRRGFLEQISPGDILNYKIGDNLYRFDVESVDEGRINGYERRVKFPTKGRTRTRTLDTLAKKDLSIVSSSDFKKVLPPQ